MFRLKKGLISKMASPWIFCQRERENGPEKRNGGFMVREAIDAVRSRQPVNLVIVIINVIVYAALCYLGDPENGSFMVMHGAAFTPYIVEGEYYRLFTSMFMHFSAMHLFNNMLVLFFLGDILEELGGKIRFLIIYLGGGMIGNIVSVVYDLYTEDYSVSAGASGAVFAVIGALVAIVLLNRGKVSKNTRQRLILMAALSVLQGLTATGVDNCAHIGGIISGFLLALLFHRKFLIQEEIPVEDYKE